MRYEQLSMSRTLPEFAKDLLNHHDALIEERGEDQLEMMLPEALASSLGLPEHGRLSFASTAQQTLNDGVEVIPASYDSNTFKIFSDLLGEGGRSALAAISPPSVNIVKLKGKVADRIVFNNAVFQVTGHELAEISYLVIYAKYTAVSDEKKEGIIVLGINTQNLSTCRLTREATRSLEELLKSIPERIVENDREDAEKSGEGISRDVLLRAAHRGLCAMTKDVLHDFIHSLERRLNRDVSRVHDYYHALMDEAKRLIEKKKVKDGEDPDKLKEQIKDKVKAIENELRLKVNDLVTKYAMNVRIEPLSFIRIQSKVPLFWLEIKRRKGSRRFPLAYHPILHTLESLPCEACYHPIKPYSICDDRLHIVCSRCFKHCPHCGKHDCKRCHPGGCAKCAKRNLTPH